MVSPAQVGQSCAIVILSLRESRWSWAVDIWKTDAELGQGEDHVAAETVESQETADDEDEHRGPRLGKDTRPFCTISWLHSSVSRLPLASQFGH